MANPKTPSPNPNEMDRDRGGAARGDDSGPEVAGSGAAARADARGTFGSARGGSDRPMQRPEDANGPTAGSGQRRRSEMAIECLASAIEVVIRELPRGSFARLEPAQDEIRKAREQLSASGDSSDPSHRSFDASSSSSRSARSDGSRGDGQRPAEGFDDGESHRTRDRGGPAR